MQERELKQLICKAEKAIEAQYARMKLNNAPCYLITLQGKLEAHATECIDGNTRIRAQGHDELIVVKTRFAKSKFRNEEKPEFYAC